MKFYKCDVCGKIIVMLNETPVPTICCGQEMKLMEAQTAEMAREKHVPVVTCEGNMVKVHIGSTDHPMMEKHFIQWVVLETNQGFYKKDLKPNEAPEVIFGLADGEKVFAAYEYCNIHGLWVNNL